MRIGYPCINRTIACRSPRTFRLASYSQKRMIETVGNNLACLYDILRFNVAHDILFFRISSGLIPFASHPVCHFAWPRHFRKQLSDIGDFIAKNRIRISMHPDQFVLINAQKRDIVARSIDELIYHTRLLDSMGLDTTAKMQIHLGGVYGNKEESIKRFIDTYRCLDGSIKKRLVLENDEVSYSVKDCLRVHTATGIPVLLDMFHHTLNNNSEKISDIMAVAGKTWKKSDGIPMVDYSFQEKAARRGRHASSINPEYFKKFLAFTKPFDFDVMLEIKDKEQSAMRAIRIAAADERFFKRSRIKRG